MVYPEKPNLLKPLAETVSSATLQSSAGLRESTVDLGNDLFVIGKLNEFVNR